MKNKIFVTGSEGFIGSHIVQLLIKKGFFVKALVQYNSFSSWGWLEELNLNEKKRIEVIFGDVRDLGGIKRVTKDCNNIIHLAALISIPYSYHSPRMYLETNITGTLNILEAAKENKIEHLIHASTSEVYGTAQYIPIDEKHPLQGQSPYSATKIAADKLVESYYRSFDLPVTTLRPFNVFGPRQSARAIIPTIISQIMNNQVVKIGSLNPTRDLNYVGDTAEAFVKCINKKNTFGETINIGSGFEISIGDLVVLIANLMKKKIKIIKDKERIRPEKSEVLQLVSSTKKAKDLLNWQSQYKNIDGLAEGLKKTINWFKKSNNLKKFKSSTYNI
jgi:NAD dependent epimerase/dehydratase